MEIPLEKVRCEPAGSVSTALDVNVDMGGRQCGMCFRDAAGKTLGNLCDHCGHRFGWFQLLTSVEALGASPRTEKALASYVRKYQSRMNRGNAFDNDGPDEGT